MPLLGNPNCQEESWQCLGNLHFATPFEPSIDIVRTTFEFRMHEIKTISIHTSELRIFTDTQPAHPGIKNILHKITDNKFPSLRLRGLGYGQSVNGFHRSNLKQEGLSTSSTTHHPKQKFQTPCGPRDPKTADLPFSTSSQSVPLTMIFACLKGELRSSFSFSDVFVYSCFTLGRFCPTVVPLCLLTLRLAEATWFF